MMWKSSNVEIPRNVVLVGLESEMVFFFISASVDQMVECERNGAWVFGRDGTPLYRWPVWWAELPEQQKTRQG